MDTVMRNILMSHLFNFMHEPIDEQICETQQLVFSLPDPEHSCRAKNSSCSA